MDWNKTKTMFIVVFLILNLFLITQYIEKKKVNEFETYSEASIEERLKQNDIHYVTLPKQTSIEQYLSAKSNEFSKEDVKKLKHQEIVSVGKKIISDLEKTYIVGEELNLDTLDAYVKEMVLYGEEYSFWEMDEQLNAIIYYQKYNEKMIYNSEQSKLILYLNDNKEVVSYEQTYSNLEEVERVKEEDVLAAIKVLEILYQKGELPAKSEITKMELGYYNLISLSSANILAPTWHIVLNKDKDIFVYATDGQIITESIEKKDEQILE